MAFYGNLRDYRSKGKNEDDVRGANILATDEEKLGEIAEVIFDSASGDARYVIVDTGGWLTSKKFIVPARHLMIREEADKDFHVALSKEQVEKLPAVEKNALDSEEGLTAYESQYEAVLNNTGVLQDSE